VGHAVQPAAQGLRCPQRAGLADQDEEGGLEGVGGVGLVLQDAAADAQDHGAVPPDQGREGRLVAVVQEQPEQFRVGRSPNGGGEAGGAQLLDHAPELIGRHKPSYLFPAAAGRFVP
jgi:hypothetical protein